MLALLATICKGDTEERRGTLFIDLCDVCVLYIAHVSGRHESTPCCGRYSSQMWHQRTSAISAI